MLIKCLCSHFFIVRHSTVKPLKNNWLICLGVECTFCSHQPLSEVWNVSMSNWNCISGIKCLFCSNMCNKMAKMHCIDLLGDWNVLKRSWSLTQYWATNEIYLFLFRLNRPAIRQSKHQHSTVKTTNKQLNFKENVFEVP